jgi:glucoside 3-dehydrogenase (cytochrome c) hitch-hiker subunit
MAISEHEVIPPVESPQPLSAALNRRDLIRAALLAAAASALGPSFSLAQAIESGLTPAARGEDGAAFLTDPNWKPAFLNDHQNESLILLSDVIIPATDTPGAKAALVNRYLDLLVSVQPSEFQEEFVAALQSIDSESQTEFGKDFRELSREDQIWLLTAWAYPQQSSHWTERNDPHTRPADLAQEHFHRLKALIAAGYYGSEIGQKELGWDGEITHGPYQGCEHQSTTHT